jgi:hypothetical protein
MDESELQTNGSDPVRLTAYLLHFGIPVSMIGVKAGILRYTRSPGNRDNFAPRNSIR